MREINSIAILYRSNVSSELRNGFGDYAEDEIPRRDSNPKPMRSPLRHSRSVLLLKKMKFKYSDRRLLKQRQYKWRKGGEKGCVVQGCISQDGILLYQNFNMNLIQLIN